MIRIGLKTPLDAVPEIAGVGFDCLELPLRDVAALSEGEFAELTEYLAYLNVRVGAVSDLIPDGLRVNGPAVSRRRSTTTCPSPSRGPMRWAQTSPPSTRRRPGPCPPGSTSRWRAGRRATFCASPRATPRRRSCTSP